jgi:acyl homoserine lactone synthase
MLKLIEESYASFFPKEMDAMFRNRAETFSERLGWEVMVKDGYERDRFDDANPLYLVSVDPDTEEYWGSLRLLPTTGPNMLRDVFPQLLDGDYIESATIWECSRICATAVRGQSERNGGGVNYVLSELILGIGEVAVTAGLTQIAAVFDARIFRVLRNAGCNPEIIGTPRLIGDVISYAGLFDTGEAPSVRFAPRPGSKTLFWLRAPKRSRSPADASASRPRQQDYARINGDTYETGIANYYRADAHLYTGCQSVRTVRESLSQLALQQRQLCLSRHQARPRFT